MASWLYDYNKCVTVVEQEAMNNKALLPVLAFSYLNVFGAIGSLYYKWKDLLASDCEKLLLWLLLPSSILCDTLFF